MGRGIDITLGLKDNLTAALRGAVKSSLGSLDSLQKKMDGMHGPKQMPSVGGGLSGSSSGGGSFLSDMVGANLISNALQTVANGILGAGQALVGAIGSQFTAAEEANRRALGATSANAALLGIAFKDSAKLTSSISKTLAHAALKLPGATKDYLDAFNGVSDTLVLSGGMTKKGLTDAGREMVELTALLGQASGAGSATTSTVLGKMLGDTGSEALFRIDAFEKVPAFKALLEKDLEKAGKTLKDFFKMDAAAKQAQLVGVKKQLFSKDYIAEMNLSMGAQIEMLKGKLFDPTSGFLGFLREVKFEGKNTTVLAELGKTFSVLVATATEALGAMGGVTMDPMLMLIKGLRRLTEYIKDPASAIPDIISLMAAGWQGVGAFMLTLPSRLIQSAGSLLMGLAMDGSQVQIIASQLTQSIIGFVTNAINSLSSSSEGNVSGIFGVILGGLALIGNVALGVLYGIAQSLPGLFGAIGSAMASGVTNFGGMFVGVLGNLAPMVADVGAQIGAAVTGFFASVLGAVGSWVSSMAEASTSIGTGIAEYFSGLIAGIPGYLSSIGSAIQNLGSAISGAISSQVSAAIGSISGAVGSVISGKGIPSRYSGQNLHLVSTNSFQGGARHMNRVLTASNGLFDAARLEASKMPSGSSLVMANSSELIIPRNQINQVLGGSGTTVNISISVHPDRIIQDTVSALTEALRKPSLSMV
jgi:hypothetical protein